MKKEEIKSLKFHIKSDDYFGTLATIISLVRQDLERALTSVDTLNKVEADLMYLQRNNKIDKK